MEKFSNWADQNMPDAGVEHYAAFKAGYQEGRKELEQLRQEIIRLHEIIAERNHTMGLG